MEIVPIKIKFITKNNSNQENQSDQTNKNIIQAFLNDQNDQILPSNEMNPMNLVDKDNQFLQIQNAIAQKRNFLLQKQKKINKISKQNKFLEEVKEDYLKYNNYITKQKQEQIMALQMLNNYIEDLSKSDSLSKNNIIDSQNEQKKIMNEIESIKQNLDNIINDTNIINSKVK